MQQTYNLICLWHLYQKRLCGEEYSDTYNRIVEKKNILPKSNLDENILNCVLCKRSLEDKNNKIIGTYGQNSQIGFITMLPLIDKQNQLKNTKSALMLQNIITNVFNLQKDQYSILSVIKCLGDGLESKIEESSKFNCVEFCIMQLDKVNAPLYLIFGEEVAFYVLGKTGEKTYKRGEMIEQNNKRFLITFSLGQISKNPSLKRAMYDDLLKAKTFLTRSGT